MAFYSGGYFYQLWHGSCGSRAFQGCGRTTIAEKVLTILSENAIRARVLQLDEIRRAITPKPKYTEEERDIVYASLAYMAKLLADEGINVIIDATANRRRYRDFARSQIPDFAEVLFGRLCPSAWKGKRSARPNFSPKDIYKKAADERAFVPGVNVAYEKPRSPEIDVDTASMNLEKCARHIADSIMAWK